MLRHNRLELVRSLSAWLALLSRPVYRHLLLEYPCLSRAATTLSFDFEPLGLGEVETWGSLTRPSSLFTVETWGSLTRPSSLFTTPLHKPFSTWKPVSFCKSSRKEAYARKWLHEVLRVVMTTSASARRADGHRSESAVMSQLSLSIVQIKL